jgi:hypothetical protein
MSALVAGAARAIGRFRTVSAKTSPHFRERNLLGRANEAKDAERRDPPPGNLCIKVNAWWRMQSISNPSQDAQSLFCRENTGNLCELGSIRKREMQAMREKSTLRGKIPYAQDSDLGREQRVQTGTKKYS